MLFVKIWVIYLGTYKSWQLGSTEVMCSHLVGLQVQIARQGLINCTWKKSPDLVVILAIEFLINDLFWGIKPACDSDKRLLDTWSLPLWTPSGSLLGKTRGTPATSLKEDSSQSLNFTLKWLLNCYSRRFSMAVGVLLKSFRAATGKLFKTALCSAYNAQPRGLSRSTLMMVGGTFCLKKWEVLSFI